MNFRIKLYENLINGHLLVSVIDLDNDGRAAIVKVFVNSAPKAIIIDVPQVSRLPLDVFISDTPHPGKLTEITAKIYDKEEVRLHDTDTRLIIL